MKLKISKSKVIKENNFIALSLRGVSRSTTRSIGQGGFTLIELLVSVGLFLIVMVVALGAVLAIVDGNKKTQAINSVANNLNSAIESMTRDIKTGYAYKCNLAPNATISGIEVNNCPSGAIDNITFVSTISGDRRSVQYRRVEDSVTGRGSIRKYFCPVSIKAPCGGNDFIPLDITSGDVDIQVMQFYVKVPSTGTGQPGVFMIIKGTTHINKTTSSNFSIQTFVSQRLLNI